MADEMVHASWFAEAEHMDTPAKRLEELAQYARLHPLIAANPATPPSILKQLARAPEYPVRRAVALNPNTPIDQLCQLAAEFPEEFLRNPILPILNLTQPNFIKRLFFASWQSLLRCADIPPAWLQQIKNDRYYRYGNRPLHELVEMHVSQVATENEKGKELRFRDVQNSYLDKLPSAAQLSNEENTQLFLFVVLLCPSLSPMLKKQWVAAAKVAPRHVAQVLASIRQPGTKTLTSLARLPDPLIRSQVACHPATSPRILQDLARQKRDMTRAQQALQSVAASNPRTPLEPIYAFISAQEIYLRRIAARHPRLKPLDRSIVGLEPLDRFLLAQDPDATVRAALATTSDLKIELFEQLVRDPAARVRATLARNLRIPLALLNTLAGDAEPAVRAAAAANPRLPLEAQGTLVADSVETVRASLSGNARLSIEHAEQFARDPSPRVRAQLAANPRTPVSLLHKLLNTEEAEVWAALARHPRIDPHILAQLAGRDDQRTRLAVAAHTRTPVETLAELAHENTPAMWCALTSNPNTPLNVLEQALPTASLDLLYRLHQHPALARAGQRPLIALLAEQLRPLIAANGAPDWLRRAFIQYLAALPVDIVGLFALSPHWEERYLLAHRAHLPATVHKQLAQDGIAVVRNAARQALEQRQSARDH